MMKRAALFHPRVFDDPEWAQGYYKRDAKHIAQLGKRYTQRLQTIHFTGGKILDVGCGFGTIAIALAQAFPQAEIVGVDLSAPLLELAQSLAQQADVASRITFTKGDVQALDFSAATFDLAICTFMLHLVADPVAMLNEIERVTAPTGKIMITDLRRNWLALFDKKFRTVFTVKEGLDVIGQSRLRPGQPASGLFWWDYMIGV